GDVCTAKEQVMGDHASHARDARREAGAMMVAAIQLGTETDKVTDGSGSLRAARLLSEACVTCWRKPYETCKRDAECTRGAITDAFGNVGDAALSPAQEVFRQGHTPGEQVFHRRDAHGTAKSLEKR